MTSHRNALPFISKVTLLALLGSPTLAYAQMPWEGPLQQILASLQGPTVRLIIILIIISSGLLYAFGEGGPFWRRAVGIVAGCACAAGAASFAATLFGV